MFLQAHQYLFVILGTLVLLETGCDDDGSEGRAAQEMEAPISRPESSLGGGYGADSDSAQVANSAASSTVVDVAGHETRNGSFGGQNSQEGGIASPAAAEALGGNFEDDNGESSEPNRGCTLDGTLAAGERIVLVGHRFTEDPQVRGTDIRSLSLSQTGELVDLGVRQDVGFAPKRISTLPGGQTSIVMGENGELVSVSLTCQNLEIIDRLELPGAGFSDMVLQEDGRLVFLLNKDPTEGGGIYTVEVSEDGALASKGDHYALRLPQAMALYPGTPTRALLVGGQTMFEPFDDNDVRILLLENDGWREVAAFDVYRDYVQCDGIGMTGDGLNAFLTNSSPFSSERGHLVHLTVSDEMVVETQRFVGQGDLSHARALPDGRTFVVSTGESDQIRVFAPNEVTDAYALTQTIDAIGLAQQMAIAKAPGERTWILVSAVNAAEGPNVTLLEGLAVGELSMPIRVSLGNGAANIPGPIAVAP